MYSRKAWDIALTKFTQQLVGHMQRLLGGTLYGQNNWLIVLRASEEKESMELLADIEAEYERQLEVSSPALVKDLTAFYKRKEASKYEAVPTMQPTVKCSSMAPRVRKECEHVAARPRHRAEL